LTAVYPFVDLNSAYSAHHVNLVTL